MAQAVSRFIANGKSVDYVSLVDQNGNPLSFGTVELGATSLAALEHISVDAVSGTVDLSAATLAALETINAIAAVADGADVAQGAVADAAVAAGAAGTISAKLRRLTAQLAAQLPAALGQTTMAASTPVAIASDQSAIAVDTELPAAAALSDALANPTAPAVGAHLVGWDTVQWKRILQINGLLRASIGSASSVTSDGQGAPTTVTDSAAVARSLSIAPFLFNGATWDRQRTPAIFTPLSALNTNAEITAWAATASKKHRLMGFDLAGDIAGEYIIREDTAGTVLYRTYLAANVPKTVDLRNGILASTVNKPTTITGPASSHVTGTLWGIDE
jgi:hypothetical protein